MCHMFTLPCHMFTVASEVSHVFRNAIMCHMFTTTEMHSRVTCLQWQVRCHMFTVTQ